MADNHSKITDDQYRNTAVHKVARDSDLVIMDDSELDRSQEDCGCWVQAWLWVDDTEVEAVLGQLARQSKLVSAKKEKQHG